MRALRRQPGIVAAALVGLAGIPVAGCDAARHATTPDAAACTPVPVGLPAGSVIATGATRRVHLGAVIYVELIEPEGYTGRPYPSEFPWLAARSSNATVLAGLTLCPSPPATLPLALAAFRARGVGTAVLSAPLTAHWAKRRHAFRPYRATVTVVA